MEMPVALYPFYCQGIAKVPPWHKVEPLKLDLISDNIKTCQQKIF